MKKRNELTTPRIWGLIHRSWWVDVYQEAKLGKVTCFLCVCFFKERTQRLKRRKKKCMQVKNVAVTKEQDAWWAAERKRKMSSLPLMRALTGWLSNNMWTIITKRGQLKVLHRKYPDNNHLCNGGFICRAHSKEFNQEFGPCQKKFNLPFPSLSPITALNNAVPQGYCVPREVWRYNCLKPAIPEANVQKLRTTCKSNKNRR